MNSYNVATKHGWCSSWGLVYNDVGQLIISFICKRSFIIHVMWTLLTLSLRSFLVSIISFPPIQVYTVKDSANYDGFFFFLLVFVCLQSYSWYLFNGFWRGFFKLLKKQNQIKRVYKFYDQSLESLLCSYMFLFSVYNICGFPDLLLLRNNFSSICWSLEVDHLIPWNQLTWFVSNLVSD